MISIFVLMVTGLLQTGAVPSCVRIAIAEVTSTDFNMLLDIVARHSDSAELNEMLETLRRSPSQFFLVVFEEELPLLWTELSDNFDDRVNHDTRQRISLNPEFGFLEDAQNTEDDIFAAYQISDLAQILVLSRGKSFSFKLTSQSVKELQAKGVPDEVLRELQALETLQFEEQNEFGRVVGERIGEEQLLAYQDVILQHTSVPSSRIGLVRITDDTVNTWNVSLDQKVNIESWNSVIFYSQKVKDALEFREGEKDNTQNKPLIDSDSPFFDIVQFFKKWGVPGPFVVFFCVAGAYLLLSMLARNR